MGYTLPFDPITETYDEVVEILSKVVTQFTKKHKFDREEARSLANLAFVRAYHSYDPNKGSKFGTWLATKIWRHLLSGLREKIGRDKKPLEFGFNPDDRPIPESPKFRLTELLAELSEDAKRLITTAIQPPKEVEEIVKEFGQESVANYRMAIRQYLLDKGWTNERIKQSFREIRRKL